MLLDECADLCISTVTFHSLYLEMFLKYLPQTFIFNSSPQH